MKSQTEEEKASKLADILSADSDMECLHPGIVMRSSSDRYGCPDCGGYIWKDEMLRCMNKRLQILEAMLNPHQSIWE